MRCDHEHLENIATLQMELERLRENNDEMRNGPEGTSIRERLSETRSELILAHRSLRDQTDELEDLQDELERLRATVQAKQDSEVMLLTERKGLTAELECLREENKEHDHEMRTMVEIEMQLRAHLHCIEDAARRLDKAAARAEQKGAQWFPHALLTDLRATLEKKP